MFELYQLEELVAIAEYGTLSAAAERLNRSQPALTRSMQRLEAELGAALFTRTKNRASLNEAGRLAVGEARRVLEAAETMGRRMDAYVKSRHTISVGSCAPAPMWLLTPKISEKYPDFTIASEMKAPEKLLAGLRDGTYRLIITDGPMEGDGFYCREFLTERLYISLPPAHPLAQKDGVYLSELAGQTMLLYSDLGVWQRLHDEKMRDIHFIVQTEREAFSDLINASVLPCFASSLTVLAQPPINRVNVSILDPEASKTFYLVCRAADRTWLQKLTQANDSGVSS